MGKSWGKNWNLEKNGEIIGKKGETWGLTNKNRGLINKNGDFHASDMDKQGMQGPGYNGILLAAT